MVHRPKWKIALELYDRAIANALHFDWLTFDEGYGDKPELLRELSSRSQRFLAEVPRNFMGWIKPPRVVTRAYHKNGRGRGRKTPRLASGASPPIRVDEMLDKSGFCDQGWVKLRLKDGHKGPMIWEVKHLRFISVNEQGLPGKAMHLVVARDVQDPTKLKFFVSNAPENVDLETLLLVAFSRWRVERCLEDQKGEIGLDQYEGRRYRGLKRHLILSCVSYLFLSRLRQEFGEKNPELTECEVHTALASLIPYWWLNHRVPRKALERTSAEIKRTQSRNAAARRSHTKRTRRKLRDLGIKLTDLPRCKWKPT